ncbi:MAG TPA: cephalosporin hydroxylase family protein [Candidatus Paceibacterota bacterium]|nr:cephalosporin hydroxylase family protein [Candidatus Paceibacterota bacterium]
MSGDRKLKSAAQRFFLRSTEAGYSYNFEWLGRPIIQYPQDIVAMQEIIWNVKPDLIIETGIAHGGSIIFSASMLELLGGTGRVVGIDVDIRAHNRREIEKHPMFKRITLIQGSSVASDVLARVRRIAKGKKKIMVVLDSNHSHEHVFAELNEYAPLVTKGSYLVVFDTVIELMPRGANKNRPWDRGSNPMTAVKEFLKHHKEFRVDRDIEGKIAITVAPNGYLKRVK